MFRQHDLRERIFLIFALEKLPASSEICALLVYIVHELVNQGDGNLLHLSLGIGHLAHKNIAQSVNFPLYIKV